jgi:hypothetical protein
MVIDRETGEVGQHIIGDNIFQEIALQVFIVPQELTDRYQIIFGNDEGPFTPKIDDFFNGVREVVIDLVVE